MTEKEIVTLADVLTGSTVKIININAGQALKHRLAAMGLLPNTVIKVIRKEGRGQVIVGVKNGKVVLGHGMAHKVIVRQ